jgi:hypothetical protein
MYRFPGVAGGAKTEILQQTTNGSLAIWIEKDAETAYRAQR